ncbi:MAG: hypothetical protein GX548_13055, partial [Lentisphaerae bacterium]|nr:hypothetical protein [Lentisphaerota bacterium]
METNTTVIDVVFHNGADQWDNNGGADWHVNVANCGDEPPPPQTVTIDPAEPVGCGPVTITYNPSGRNLLGVNPVKIHIGRNGWQDVILPNPSMTQSGANWTYVYTPLPGTEMIDMVFNDGGAVWDNNDDADWHFAVDGCEDVPTGLAITNPPANITVSNSVATYTLAGIADGMEGDLTWTNSLTGASGTLPATAAWSIPGIALDVGGNEFVITGSNTTAAGIATNAFDDASDAAYSSGWNTGNNGGTGFSGWTLNAVEGSSGHFTGTNGMWGMWSHESNNLAEAIRPFSAPLSTGQTFHVRMQNGWIWENGGGIGVALESAEGVTIWQCYFNGGDTNYTVSSGETDIAWTDAGLDITYEITGPSDYEATVQPVGGSLRQFSGTVGGQIARFRAWSNGNGTDDGQNSNRDFFINHLMITSPTGEGVATNSDFVIITRQSGGGPVP